MTADAAALDAADPLARHRDRFVGADTPLVYFDGNSLGRPLAVTADRLASFVREEWGGRLIRGWDERWYDLPLTLGDEIGRVCLGAAAGQTFVGDSTTVLLYKLIRAGVDHVGRDRPAAHRDRHRHRQLPDRPVRRRGDRRRAWPDRPVGRGGARGGRHRRAARRGARPGDGAGGAQPRRLPLRVRRRRRGRHRGWSTTPARWSSGTSRTPSARCRSPSTPGASTSRSAAPTSTSTAAPAPPRSGTSRPATRTPSGSRCRAGWATPTRS